LAFCLVSVGCNRHSKEVNTFITERNEVLGQMLDKIDASPNEAGIDEARKIFDARKADLKAKQDAMPRGTNLSSDDLLALLKSDTFNSTLWDAVQKKSASQKQWDRAVDKKFYALENDFDSTFK
jgi:hypothetical protein